MLTLEKVANIAVIGLCLVACTTLLLRKQADHPSARRMSSELVGRALNDVRLADGYQTHLMIVISRDCHFCQESMPLYRTIADTKNRFPGLVEVTVVSKDTEDVISKYLSDNHVDIDRVIRRDLSRAGIRGTPTLALLDSSGVIRQAFVGKQTRAGEQQILSVMRTGLLSTRTPDNGNGILAAFKKTLGI